MEYAAQIALLYIVLPVWILAGLADWLCHRRSDIYHTSGPKESVIHLLMLAEAAAPLLLCLLFEINALLLGIACAVFVLHEFTSHWDIHYAASRREITPIEQHVHAYLGTMPFMALLLLVILHWPQAASLIGLGPEPADFALRWKDPALPPWYVVGLLGAVALFEGLPYLHELLRGVAAQSRTGRSDRSRN